MYFKKVEHRNHRVASQVRRTVVITFLEMCMHKVSNILQVTMEFSDKILRELYSASATICFMDSEKGIDDLSTRLTKLEVM